MSFRGVESEKGTISCEINSIRDGGGGGYENMAIVVQPPSQRKKPCVIFRYRYFMPDTRPKQEVLEYSIRKQGLKNYMVKTLRLSERPYKPQNSYFRILLA